MAKRFFQHLLLLSVSAVLYASAFPNPLIPKGFPPAAWFCYIGVFVVIRRTSFYGAPLWGAFFGALSITLHNYWLSLFHPLAGIIAALLFAIYVALLFFALKSAALLTRQWTAITQCCIWIGFEYLRTLGFLGYSYGITGYSQWTIQPLLRAASIGGVWALSALVIFPQATLAQARLPGFKRLLHCKLQALSVRKMGILLWAVLLLAALGYGIFCKIDYSTARMFNIALLQPNSNPWKSDMAEFRKEFNVLRQLSEKALAAETAPELVVWPETAFVPSFYYHDRYRVDAEASALVREAEAYLAAKHTPFVLGNNEGRRVTDDEGERVAEYNAALLFDNGAFTGRYYKMHLVPFTESFPYKEWFPSLYQLLLDVDSHFWEKGREPLIFETAGIRFCTPICFEDTFGADVRRFIQQGAELIVNLSNDSWSHSLSAQYQHLSIAVFRAAESGRAMVRSTATGQTSAIDPNGVVLAMAEPWIETTLAVKVPILNGTTFYTRFGDWLPLCSLAAAAILLVWGAIGQFPGRASAKTARKSSLSR